MEVVFLSLLDFRVSVTSWEFSNYASHVEEHMNNIGRPKLFFVAQEVSLIVALCALNCVANRFLQPSITPITPDTTNSMLMHVSPAAQMVTST